LNLHSLAHLADYSSVV